MPHNFNFSRPYPKAVTLFSALALLCLVPSTLAHEGHGTEEVGVYDLDAPRTVSQQTAKHIGLKTAEVDFQPVEQVVTLSGTVKALPNRRHAVVSLLEGQVLHVNVRVGDQVKVGQPLVQIKSLAFLERWSRLHMIRARVLALTSQQTAAEEQWQRTKALAGQAIAERELALRKAELVQVQSQLALEKINAQQTQAWLKAVAPKVDLDQLPHQNVILRAQINGYVIKRNLAPGQWATAGQVIVQVADFSKVQIQGELPESLISQVRARQSDVVRVRIPSDPDFLAQGKLRFIAPELEPNKRTAHLIIDVDNPDGALRGQMWVDLAIVLRQVKQALVVPRKAVVVQGPLHFVFIHNGDVYQKQDIQPGVRDDQYIEVRDGLVPGDQVVVAGAYSLTHLKPKKAAPPAITEDEPEEEHKDDGHEH